MLRRTHLLRSYSGSDVNLIAELSLYGKFIELPQRLFYRRFHEKSGSWKRGDPKHEAEFYYAASARRVAFTKWRTHLAFFSATNASPLPAQSKLKLYRHLAKRMIWDRTNLLIEILKSATTLASQ